LTNTNVFLCYRREDSKDLTDTIEALLSRSIWNRMHVFQDVSSIAGGAEWKLEIQRHISHSQVLLTIIGPKWLSISDNDGLRRIDSSSDPVRQEIETALHLHIPIIPVLVGGALMPDESQLPESLKRIREFQAVTVRGNPYLKADIGTLRTAILKRRTTWVRRRRAAIVTFIHSFLQSASGMQRRRLVGYVVVMVLVLTMSGVLFAQYPTLTQIMERLGSSPTATSIPTVRPTATATCLSHVAVSAYIHVADPQRLISADQQAIAAFQTQVQQAYSSHADQVAGVLIIYGGGDVSNGIELATAVIKALKATPPGPMAMVDARTEYYQPLWNGALSPDEVRLDTYFYQPC
jgi:hypothetical protein